jgi:hypothetical protein
MAEKLADMKARSVRRNAFLLYRNAIISGSSDSAQDDKIFIRGAKTRLCA